MRGWADALPFATGSFDAVLCKGALDHFDTPALAIAEMARVTRADGRVVLAIANFDSLACRVARAVDALRRALVARDLPRGRRHYDVPHDHFTRYDLGLMREQAGACLELELRRGHLARLGAAALVAARAAAAARLAQRLLAALDAIARCWPARRRRGACSRAGRAAQRRSSA